jgi:hypothetical protein
MDEKIAQTSYGTFTAENQGIDRLFGRGLCDMAFTHHELSAENAVIPFSLSLPTSFSSAGPATFEMEHFQK